MARRVRCKCAKFRGCCPSIRRRPWPRPPPLRRSCDCWDSSALDRRHACVGCASHCRPKRAQGSNGAQAANGRDFRVVAKVPHIPFCPVSNLLLLLVVCHVPLLCILPPISSPSRAATHRGDPARLNLPKPRTDRCNRRRAVCAKRVSESSWLAHQVISGSLLIAAQLRNAYLAAAVQRQQLASVPQHCAAAAWLRRMTCAQSAGLRFNAVHPSAAENCLVYEGLRSGCVERLDARPYACMRVIPVVRCAVSCSGGWGCGGGA